MLESLLGGYVNKPTLYLDISFEDAELGSVNFYDKVSKTNLLTKLSTLSGTLDSRVVNHATYGKTMLVNTGRFWWLPNLTTPIPGLVIEVTMALTSIPTSQSFFINTGGWNGSGSYLSGYGLSIRSSAIDMGFYPDNGGGGVSVTTPMNRLVTLFIEHNSDGSTVRCGIRDMLPVSISYYAKAGTGFYFGLPPYAILSSQNSFKVFHNGYLKSIKIYKK